MRELYGQNAIKAGKKNGGELMTAGADWRNPHQTYTNQKKDVASPLINDATADRKARKAAQLHSNIATHTDEKTAESRLDQFNKDKKRVFMASNAGWNDQNGYAKPQNSGKPSAYNMRQAQLESNVLH